MSDQDTTIFTDSENTNDQSSSTPEVKTEVTQVQQDNHADLLKTIVREDGTQKYANIPDALTALTASQEYIKKLETENAQYKSTAESNTTVEETAAKVLEQIKAAKSEETTPSPEIDMSQVEALVAETVTNTLTAKEKSDIAKANEKSVIDAFTDKYGDKAEEMYIKLAEENGLGSSINTLSAQTPQVVLKLAGLDNVKHDVTQSSGSINTQSLAPKEEVKSSRVAPGATSRDLATAWNNARPD